MTGRIDLGLPIPANGVDFSRFMTAERLIRLHPHWYVKNLTRQGDWFQAVLQHHATENALDLTFTLLFPGRSELMVVLESGPVTHIHFFPQNRRLHVSFKERKPPLQPDQEQDLTLWLQSIRQYLRLYLKATPVTLFFRFLMNQALLKMNPSQRKISLMLYRVTVLEIAVTLIIVIGYLYFGRA